MTSCLRFRIPCWSRLLFTILLCLAGWCSALALSINPPSRTFPKEGGGAAIVVTGTEAEAWTVTTDSAWLNVTPTKSGKGNGTVTYLVSANLTADQRVGQVTINSIAHTVYQNGYESVVSPLSGLFERSGGTGSITVSVLAGVSWTATTNAPWISLTGRSNGLGNGTITYSVSPFLGTGSRTGTISIAGKVFTITQNGVPIALSPEEVRVDDRSNLILFSVTALASQKWSVTANDEWISVITPGTGAGDSAVTLAVGENPSYLQRVGTVSVGSANLRVIQDGNRAPTLAIDPPSATAGAAGAFGLIAVSATPEAPWAAQSNVPWITITEGASGAGSGNIRYVVSANPTTEDRNGSIVVLPSPQRPPADLSRALVGHFPGQDPRNWTGRAGNLSGPLEFVASVSTVKGLLARRDPGFTFSFWFRPTYLGRVNRLVEFASTNGVTFTLYTREDNRLYVHSRLPNSGGEQVIASDYVVNNAVLQHLTGILGADNSFSLYLDKVKILQANYGSSPIPPANRDDKVSFGQTTLPTSGNYAGSISDVRFYHRSLSLEELGLLCDMENAGKQVTQYNGTTPREEGRFSSYSFANNGFDSTLSGLTAGVGDLLPTPDRFGRQDMALNLSGPIDLPTPQSSFSGKDVAVNLWVKFSGINDSAIIQRNGGGNEAGIFCAPGGFRFKIGELRYTNLIEKSYDLNKWHMLTLCADFIGLGSRSWSSHFIRYSYRVYLNGGLVFQSAVLETSFFDSPNRDLYSWGLGGGMQSIRIGGANPNASGVLAIDDATIFDKRLSDADVLQVYESSRPSVAQHVVTQTPAVGTLSSNSGQYPASGATGTTRISISGGVGWSARSNVPWITLVSASDAAGSADITFRLDDNSAIYPREGTVTIAGLTYTAFQAGRNHSVDSGAFSFGPDGGLGVFNLSTEVNASWRTVASDDWITVVQGQSGTGPAAVMFVTSPYSSPTGYRSGTVTIGSSVVAVTQIGYEASVVPLVQAIPAGGGQKSIQVQVPIGAVWEAVSRAPWITLIGGQSRSGSGELNFIVAGNSGGPRSGTIVIAGKEVIVSQPGAPSDDMNNNGMPDSWELANLGGLNQGASDDGDSDGFSNYVEWRYGTNPRSVTSLPNISLSIHRAVQVQFDTVSGVVYDLDSSTDLSSWEKLGGSVVGDGRVSSGFFRSEQVNTYYRLRVRNP